MKRVVVYTSPRCTSCAQAKAFLNQRDVAFEECDISRDSAAMNELIRLGCRRLPVVRVDHEICEGFDAAKLRKLLKVEISNE